MRTSQLDVDHLILGGHSAPLDGGRAPDEVVDGVRLLLQADPVLLIAVPHGVG